MSWLTVIWSMCSSACLFLALLHLGIAFLGGKRRANLLISLIAASAGIITLAELSGMKGVDPDFVTKLLPNAHLILGTFLIPIPWLIQIQFGTGYRWLAWLGSLLWVATIVIDYALPGGLPFAEITGHETRYTFWDESFKLTNGTRHPLALVPDLAVLAILVHVVSASILLARRGRRRRALLTGGSITLFLVAALAHVPFVDLGILKTPTFIGPSFMMVVAAFSLQLAFEAADSTKLARKVEANELRWHNLLDHIRMLVAEVDHRGRFTYVNPFMAEISGYQPDELIGKSFETTIPPTQIDRVQKLFSQSLDGMVHDSVEIPLLAKSGSKHTIAWNTILLRDDNQQPSGTLSVGADLTASRRVETSLRETRTVLEQADRVNMLGELTATLAHELNQPLAAILANAQATRRLMQVDAPDLLELREINDDIIRDDKRASDVIQRLRALIRQDKTKIAPCNLHQLVHDTLKLCQPELDSRQIPCELLLEAPNPVVNTGEVELQQVLLNLIANAMHAMSDTPSKLLRIHTENRGGSFLIRVTDTGCGISPEVLSSIFDPLSTTRSEGLGMGLAICRRLLEKHGGRIEARNRRDTGAEFLITLPSL